MNIKKDEMIAFMSKQDIEIPNPIPTKSVLLEKILIIFKNIEKQYAIDSMTEKGGCSVLRLPLYHCILSPIKMAWNQLKYHVRHLNVYTSNPSKVVKIGIKEEEKFRIMDDILDNEIEPFVIHLSENGDVNDSWDEM